MLIALLLGACSTAKQHEPYPYTSSNPNSLYYTNPIVSERADPWIYEHNGIWYLMWSGAGAKGNSLYIAQMENPWTLSSSRIMLTEPEYDWEQRAVVHVTEAPEVIKYNDCIYLTYSASFCDANYNMGLLSARADGSDAQVWFITQYQ